MRLVLPDSLREAVIRHSLEERPYEACGLLTGKGEQVLHAYAVDSVRRHRYSFQVDPEQQAAVLAEAAERGEELVGIYHSHPTGHAYPSAQDLQQAVHYPEAVRVILSLARGVVVRAFQIEGGRITEVRIESPPDPTGEWHDLRQQPPGREV